MSKIYDISQNQPHEVMEVMCVKCYSRWIATFPTGILLKDLQCPSCNNTGFVIATGQPLPDTEDCSTCERCVNDKCMINLHYDDYFGCDYYKQREY